MSMSWADWRDLARVYETGAERQRGYSLSTESMKQAQALEAMRDKCLEVAAERNDGKSVTWMMPAEIAAIAEEAANEIISEARSSGDEALVRIMTSRAMMRLRAGGDAVLAEGMAAVRRRLAKKDVLYGAAHGYGWPVAVDLRRFRPVSPGVPDPQPGWLNGDWTPR